MSVTDTDTIAPDNLAEAQRIVDEAAARRRHAEAERRQAELQARFDALGPEGTWAAAVARAPRDPKVHENVERARQGLVRAVESGGWSTVRDWFLRYSEARIAAAFAVYERYRAEHFLWAHGLTAHGGTADPTRTPQPPRMPYINEDEWQAFSAAVDSAFDELSPRGHDAFEERLAGAHARVREEAS
jgi:hypothetical protein